MKTILSLAGLVIFLLAGFSSLHAQPVPELTDTAVLELASNNIATYRKSLAEITLQDEGGKALKGAQLEIRQVSHDFLFGALAFDLVWDRRMEPERIDTFKARFTHLFNLAVLPFYWRSYESRAGYPRWDLMEPVLDWCMDEGITCKGHPLAWTNRAGLPDYVHDVSLEDSETLLEARIIENVTGFRDRITLWDVVNEAVNTVSWEMAYRDRSAEHRYRNDLPLEEVADWVEQAFRTAYGACPDNAYILNEYRQFADTLIRKRFYDLTAELLERGTPVGGLGIQAHEPREDWYDPVEVWKTLELYSSFGLPIHITEFSPQSGGAEITGGYRTGRWTPETQAEYAENMYRICFGHPSVVSFNWWGFSDANSWLPGAGFVNAHLDPKPVYRVLEKLIREEWTTPAVQARTDRRGTFSFRGFHGDYEIRVTREDGQVEVFRRHLGRDGDSQWVLRTGG